jgi:transposase
MDRKPYPSDISDDEWAFVSPSLTLMTADAPQRSHDLREVFNGLRWIARAGAPWWMMPNDLPPWEAVYQHMRRWLRAGVFEAVVHDVRVMLRLADGRTEPPSAAILDSRTRQSTPESGPRTGQAWVTRIVRRLFEHARDWQLWASLAGHLPLLAEAAPEAFLAAVERGLVSEPPMLVNLFTDAQHYPMESSPHTGLLWALELLA